MRRGRLAVAAACLSLAASGVHSAWAQRSEGDPAPLWLRMAADSATVGHYKFTIQESRRLVFDIPADDPRAELVASLTTPRDVRTEIATTVVSTPDESEKRRYILYWLGYRVSGGQVRGLSSLQWDSIFQKVGRRAVLRFSSTGQPRGIEVGSDAVRPVATALADALAGMGMTLPSDSVRKGSRWSGEVLIPLRAPDGSPAPVVVDVSYRLRDYRADPGGLRVRIEFDGAPLQIRAEGARVSGRYYGESVFAVAAGRYEQLMAMANLEVTWADSTGLPPNRSLIEWRAQADRVGN